MSPSPNPPKKRGNGCAALFALVVLALAAGAYFYATRVLFPRPTAQRHVPLGAHFLARCDFVELATSQPVRERILPVLVSKELDAEDAHAKVAHATLADDLAEKTGIRLPDDARELVAASVDGRRWVIALGGSFARGRFVGGLEALLRERGYSGWSRDGELLVHSMGLASGQADDGTLLFATHRDTALAALPARGDDDAAPLPVPTKGALAFEGKEIFKNL